MAEIQDFSLRQGIETIRGRVDKFGVSEPTIIKKGTDIVIELPGLEQRDFERIKSIIGRTAQLQFKVVDSASDYAKKVAATVPPGQRRHRRARQLAQPEDRRPARGRLPAGQGPRRRWRSSSAA